MTKEFKLPDLGEGIHEGEIVEVLVAVGDHVVDGLPVLVVETDKATTEIPSPVTGIVEEIRVKPGDVVQVGNVLMTFTEERAAEGEKPKERPEKPKEPEKPARAERQEIPEAPSPPQAFPEWEEPVPASPSTRRLARELDVDLHRVPPTGPAGQVTAEDVRAFAEGAKKSAQAPTAPPSRALPETRPEAAQEAAPQVPPEALQFLSEEEIPLPPFPCAKAPPLADFSQWGSVQRVPLRSIRRAAARHLAMAWSQIPHVTHQDVADITELEALRQKHKNDIRAQGGTLSLTVFALKAAVAALKTFPRFNSSLDMDAEEIILKKYYHIGLATDTDRGLIVPTIRDVDRKSMTELARELAELARRTREGKTEREDVVGGTFTITNIGTFGGTGFVPIINYPQVAILGLAQARLQPVVQGTLESYRIVPRLMLPLLVAFDHRVLDGADAARFLRMVINGLENPEKLMMMI